MPQGVVILQEQSASKCDVCETVVVDKLTCCSCDLKLVIADTHGLAVVQPKHIGETKFLSHSCRGPHY